MKLLYGICGIGNGHLYRQLPGVMNALEARHEVVVYGYQTSYDYFKRLEGRYSNLTVLPVAVPYLLGTPQGLDLEASLRLKVNQQPFLEVNLRTLAETKRRMGRPDLVMTDYEPVSAQYAYWMDAPLHTFDQQSKFLFGDFPEEINGCTLIEEVERLRLFFPKAQKRIIASFFDFKTKSLPVGESIEIVKPPMSERTQKMKAKLPGKSQCRNEILVYLSPQLPNPGPLAKNLYDWSRRWTREGIDFLFYLPGGIAVPENSYEIGASQQIGAQTGDYDRHLEACSGIICTAGHGLLSEAVYLEKQVLAIALDLYEQQLNAKMIQELGRGVHTTVSGIDRTVLDRFVSKLEGK